MTVPPNGHAENLLLALADLASCFQTILRHLDPNPSTAVAHLLERLDELDHAIVDIWVEQAGAYPTALDAIDTDHIPEVGADTDDIPL